MAKNDVYNPKLFNQSLQYLKNVKDKLRKAGIPENKIRGFFEVMPNPFADRKLDLLHILQPDKPLAGGLNFVPHAMKDMLARGETSGDSVLS